MRSIFAAKKPIAIEVMEVSGKPSHDPVQAISALDDTKCSLNHDAVAAILVDLFAFRLLLLCRLPSQPGT